MNEGGGSLQSPQEDGGLKVRFDERLWELQERLERFLHEHYGKERLQRYFHDHVGWHFPANGITGWDGASFHATCKFCGKDIMQDSQGNWF